MLRFLLWGALGALAALVVLALAAWFLDGGLVALLAHHAATAAHTVQRGAPRAGTADLASAVESIRRWAPAAGVAALQSLLLAALALGLAWALVRTLARRARRYVRLRVEPYRTDRADVQALVSMYESLHGRLLNTSLRRLALGQPSVALELHYDGAGASHPAWLAVSCPADLQRLVEAALQCAYPNCQLRPAPHPLDAERVLLRLRKRAEFIRRARVLDRFEHAREPAVNRLLSVMAAAGAPACVQLSLTPSPVSFEALAKRMHASAQAQRVRQGGHDAPASTRTMVHDAELRGGLDLLNVPLYFADVRILGPTRSACRRTASELRAHGAENRLVEAGTTVRHGLLGLYRRRLARGEGNPLPSVRKGVYSSSELAALWHLPSIDYSAVPIARSSVPRAPAPAGILRVAEGQGTLRDALGPVSIHIELRRQNTAVPGTVEQGKTSYLVASVAEDLRREHCAVIVLDPKGDAADATVSLVARERTCTLLDFAHPTCGFNPLAVDAPADVIADYVVAALRNLFSDADIRASSDRYLRNAIIAVLAYDRSSSLWDAARLLSVGEDGYAYRRRVAAHLRELPEFKEIAEFFTAELTAQLADARSTTTAKLDAPVNKLARLLNSASIKRVLLNESLRVDFDRIIAGGEVLVVKGALGAMGAGNTSVLMQLLVGMLDAALARQQDLAQPEQRVAVALKIDEAPLVLNRGFAETMALKRSAGLETVACWQTDAQWLDREVRDQLDALFAHRVYFATASARDARGAASLTMAEFSDTVGAGLQDPSTLARPDVRLHLPKHHAIASWSTLEGRQAAFIAQTIPLRVDRERLALHAALQRERGARHLTDLRQPHWDRARREPAEAVARPPRPPRAVSPGATRAHATSSATPLSVPTTDAPAPPASATAAPSQPAFAPTTPAPAPAREELPAPSSQPPCESYRELVDLDRAQSVRRARPTPSVRELAPDELDLEMLRVIATLRCVLSSQLHRHFNASRAASTTQRRLKRLSDAGLVERFQFHRRDGGGVPMCYTLSAAGAELLAARGPQQRAHGGSAPVGSHATSGRGRGRARDGEGALRQARHEVHVAGLVLALARELGSCCSALRGPDDSVLSPPQSAGEKGAAGLRLADLRLPDARVPHDFTRTLADGRRVEVERFETLRPDAVLETPRLDLIVEFDDRVPAGPAAAKLERYDHFLTGWSAHTRRYGPRGGAVAWVLFVCRDRRRARECASAADAVLCACRAYAGEYPVDWEYPAREHVLYAAERDVHEGLMWAYATAPLPPSIRVTEAHRDPRAAEPQTRARQIPGAPDRG